MTTLVDQYLEWLRIRGCTAHTIAERRKNLNRIDHALPYGIEAATADELKAWLYRDGWSAWTKATSALLLAIRALATAEGVEDGLLAEWCTALPDLPRSQMIEPRETP